MLCRVKMTTLRRTYAEPVLNLRLTRRLGANLQLAHSSPNPVTALPPSSQGFHDAFGSSWEWAEDHYAAFEGFKVHHFYEDFSTPCFGGKHQLVS